MPAVICWSLLIAAVLSNKDDAFKRFMMSDLSDIELISLSHDNSEHLLGINNHKSL